MSALNFIIRKGDKVAVLMSPGPDFVHTFFALAQLGAVFVPLSPQVRRRGLRAVLDLLDDEDERHRLGAAGPAVARELDWRRVGERWVRALAPLMEGL